MSRWRVVVVVLTVVSVLLAVAVAGLWISSFLVEGYVAVYQSTRRHVYIGSGNGTVVIRQSAIVSPAEAVMVPDLLQSAPDHAPFALPIRGEPGGQAAFVVVGPVPFDACWFARVRLSPAPRMTLLKADGTSVTVTGRLDAFVISYWVLLLPFAVLPAVWYRRHRKLRRIRLLGLCPVCGYDLRATPERCPECGTVALPGA